MTYQKKRRFHISPKDGQWKECRAKATCPWGSAEHNSMTTAEKNEANTQILADQHGGLTRQIVAVCSLCDESSENGDHPECVAQFTADEDILDSFNNASDCEVCHKSFDGNVHDACNATVIEAVNVRNALGRMGAVERNAEEVEADVVAGSAAENARELLDNIKVSSPTTEAYLLTCDICNGHSRSGKDHAACVTSLDTEMRIATAINADYSQVEQMTASLTSQIKDSISNHPDPRGAELLASIDESIARNRRRAAGVRIVVGSAARVINREATARIRQKASSARARKAALDARMAAYYQDKQEKLRARKDAAKQKTLSTKNRASEAFSNQWHNISEAKEKQILKLMNAKDRGLAKANIAARKIHDKTVGAKIIAQSTGEAIFQAMSDRTNQALTATTSNYRSVRNQVSYAASRVPLHLRGAADSVRTRSRIVKDKAITRPTQATISFFDDMKENYQKSKANRAIIKQDLKDLRAIKDDYLASHKRREQLKMDELKTAGRIKIFGRRKNEAPVSIG